MADPQPLPNAQPMEIEADSSFVMKSMDVDAGSNSSATPSDAKVLMKFSLTMSKSSAARPPLFPKPDKRLDDEVEYVTEFDGNGRKVKESSVKIIPMIENTWRPEKRMKNIMIEADLTSSTEDRFETDTVFSGSQPNVQYGLVKRKRSSSAVDALDVIDEGTPVSPTANGHSQLSVQEREIQKLREDVETLPEETSMEAYENVSVEEFGEALLRGMGWEKGKPIGRNCTQVVAPIQHVKKFGRAGLGAIPAPQPEKEKKIRKPGESEKSNMKIGRIMCIIAGKYTGLRGQIADLKDDSCFVIHLDGGRRTVCRQNELAEVGSVEEEKAMIKLHRKADENGVREAGSDRSGEKDRTTEESTWKKSESERDSRKSIKQSKMSREKFEGDKNETKGNYRNREEDFTSRTSDRHKSETKRKQEREYNEKGRSYEYEMIERKLDKEKREDSKRVGQSWLCQDIRVKIIDKVAYGRKWYLQKGCIVDVVSPFICDIQMDDGGKILQKVKQEHLETALPKQGGRVLIVGGKYRGQTGRLQERISEKGVGIVQMDETYEIITSDLDNVAEFVGSDQETQG